MDEWADLPAVVVLVGTSGSGKTTLRRALVASGMPADAVVSLDDPRHQAQKEGCGPWQTGPPVAGLLRRRGPRGQAPVRRPGRVRHRLPRRRDPSPAAGPYATCGAAVEAGLEARAVLTPLLPLEELVRRNDRRSSEEQVPVDVLARMDTRRCAAAAELAAGVDLAHLAAADAGRIAVPGRVSS